MSDHDPPRDPGAVPDLDDLYADRVPAPELEDRIVRVLRSRGLLSRRRARGWRTWIAGAAASLVLFGAGWTLGKASDGGLTAGEDAYMLLLWEGPGFGADAPPGSIADEYARWARATAARGIPIAGDELAPERVLVGGTGAGDGTAGDPGTPGASVRLGGYFLVSTSDESVAFELADSHPHVSNGGWVEVARVVR